MADESAANSGNPTVGGGPQAFGSRRHHHTALAATHTEHDGQIVRSAFRWAAAAKPATAASIGK